MTILFIDPVCPAPYAARSLAEGALGGTEATVVRVAEGLAARGHAVTVAQHTRTEPERSASGVHYTPYDFKSGTPRLAGAEAVVVLRAHKTLLRIRRHYPEARLFLWRHCFAGSGCKALGDIVRETGAHAVAVSHHHAQTLRAFVAEHSGDAVPVSVCYNPVELEPDETPVQPNKLVFFSSPHKGLDQVLRAFEAARAWRPDLQLFVANPGYLSQEHRLPRGVVTLGALPHREVIGHVREAFCVFYPQSTFAETFGLVFAEANAVGTPVLTHPIGSAGEVLGETPEAGGQLVDARDVGAVVARLRQWHETGRPGVKARQAFRLGRVLDGWEALLSRQSVPTHDVV